MIPLVVGLAGAAPTFHGAPEDVRLAQAAWAAAEECTGRVPAVAPDVDIVRDMPALAGDGGFAGFARWGVPKRARIRLVEDARPATIAHEVAHAWVHEGPQALVEGRTELLTACVKARRPDLFHEVRDHWSELTEMPELRTWRFTSEDEHSAGTYEGYLASFRLFRAVGVLVPPERLWAEEVTTWDAVEAALAEAGEPGGRVLAVLRGGVDAQRAALQDPDLDALPNLYEALAGTDPERWDTDGDGWWDGAPEPRPPGAVPLARERRDVCLPAVPPGAENVVVEYGGGLGGVDLPARAALQGTAGLLVQWEPRWKGHPGGVWVRAAGDGLATNDRCAMRPHVTVRAQAPVPAGALDALAGAVEATLLDFAHNGRPTPNATLTVEGDELYAQIEQPGPRVVVPTRIARRLTDPEAARAAGRQFAALAAHADLPSVHAPAAAAAWVRLAYRDAPATPLLDAKPYDVKPWIKAAGACADGWTGVLAGACASPLGPAR